MRASSVSDRLQQRLSPEMPNSSLWNIFKVTPVTSYPASCRSRAAVLLSTPPLMAIKTFFFIKLSPQM